jgi:CRISPR type III-B/RAMP module-associated protein Cmr3
MLELYEIKPYDFWLFGGLRNFQAGSDTFREPIFPPDIMKFFHLVDLDNCVPAGVFLQKENELYLPVPADLLQPRKGQAGVLKISPLEDRNSEPLRGALTDLDLEEKIPEKLPFVRENNPKYEGAKGFISLEKLERYFTDGCLNATTDDLKSLGEFVEFETKVGLTLDFLNFTAEESRLYTTFVVRPKKDTTLAVLYLRKNSTECISDGDYHVGGETRISKVVKVDENNRTFKD